MVDFDPERAAQINTLLFGEDKGLQRQFWNHIACTFARVTGLLREFSKGLWVTPCNQVFLWTSSRADDRHLLPLLSKPQEPRQNCTALLLADGRISRYLRCVSSRFVYRLH